MQGRLVPNFSPVTPDVGGKCKCKTLSAVTEEMWSSYTLKTEGKLKEEIPICIAWKMSQYQTYDFTGHHLLPPVIFFPFVFNSSMKVMLVRVGVPS